jgi:tetratricopeptide (TPR) repeat protein
VIDDLLNTVAQYRADAQDLRRRARRESDATQREALFRDASAEFQKAITALDRGLRTVRRQQEGHTSDVCRLLESLSQTLGSLGGTWRDAGKLQEAIRYYDQGNVYEEERRRYCAHLDTYNMLQRLIVRLLAKSDLAGQEEFKADLNTVRAEIERQVSSGRNDSWALADLALTRFLCGVEADTAIADLERGKAEATFYESTYNAVTSLIDEGLGRGGALGDQLEAFRRLLQRKGGLQLI